MKSHESNVNAIRLPSPHEEILGIFLQEGKLFQEYQHRLKPRMFGEYEWLFAIMTEVMRVEELTFRAVAGRCRDKIELLHALRNCVATVHTLPALVTELKKRSMIHELQGLVTNVYRDIQNDSNPDDILRKLQQQSLEMTTTEIDGVSDPNRDVDEWAEWLEEIMNDPSKAFGLMTGLNEMDRLTTGFHRTDFVVFGGRTSMGKTALIVQILLNMTRNNYKCAMFSLEMTKRQLYNRMISNLMGASLEVVRTGQLAKERAHEITKWKDMLKKIYVDDSRGISADYIADTMRMLKRNQGLDVVVVDYLQDVKETGEQNDNSGSALARICRKLRAAAKECDCVVIGLSQISRDVEKRENKRPAVSDLSGSTGIETSADVIGLLYRDEYYNPDTSSKGILEIDFSKQRNGKVGKVEMAFVGEYQRICSLERRNEPGRVRHGTS